MLKLEVFGTINLRREADGEVVSLSRMGLSLLAYVGINGTARRKDLARVLWPGAEPSRARHSLRQLLFGIRSALDGDVLDGSDTLSLAPGRISCEWGDFQESLEAGDEEAVRRIVRGPLLGDLDVGRSPALEDWRDIQTDRFRTRFGAYLAGLHARALVAGSQERLRELEAWARIVGLEPSLLDMVQPGLGPGELAGGRVGAEGLRTLVYRARAGLPHLVSPCLTADPDGVASRTETEAAALPETTRPTVIRCVATPDATSGLDVALQVLDGLLRAPGAAGADPESIDLLKRLREGAAVDVGTDRLMSSLKDALWDALDAVLHEAPLILVLSLKTLDTPAARVLADSVRACTPDAGLSVILCGEDPAAFHMPEASALLSVFAERAPLVLEPSGARLEPAPGAPWGAADLPAGHAVQGDDPQPPTRRLPPARVGVAAGAALVTAALAWVWAAPDPEPDLGPEGAGVLLCSQRAGGGQQLYRVSLRGGATERVSPLVLSPGTCNSRIGLPTWDTDGSVSVLLEDGRTVVTFDLTGNPRDHAPEVGRTVLPPPSGPVGAPGTWAGMSATPDGRLVLWSNSTAGSSAEFGILTTGDGTFEVVPVALPLGAGATDVLGDEVLVEARPPGVSRATLYLVHLRTGAIQRVGQHEESTSNGHFLGTDQILYEVGNVGDAEDGGLELWVADRTLGTSRRLTENDFNDLESRVSPDASRICWRSEEFGHWSSDIQVMNLRTGDMVTVERSQARQGDCRWTPDSDLLLFNEIVPAPDAGLKIARSDGSAVRMLARAQGSNDQVVGFFLLR